MNIMADKCIILKMPVKENTSFVYKGVKTLILKDTLNDYDIEELLINMLHE